MQTSSNITSRSAFTLIELSIVLVIIGLLVGGVLVGRDLIKQSEIRAFMTDTLQYETAVNTFRGKYDCLPGDCATMSSFIPGTLNGDGNGTITCATPTSDDERVLFWHHLSLAKLIPGRFSWLFGAGCYYIISGTTLPSARFSPKIGYNFAILDAGSWGLATNVSGFQIGALGITNNWTDWLWGSGLTAPQASAVDSKMDDGKPSSGKITANDSTEPSAVNSSTTCVSGSAYAITNPTSGCSFYYSFLK